MAKNMEFKSNSLALIISLVVLALVSLALIGSLGDSVWENVNAFTEGNNTVDVTADRFENLMDIKGTTTFTLTHDWIDTVSVAECVNGTVPGNAAITLTEDTDYTIDKDAGTFKLLNSTVNRQMLNSNMTTWNYTHGDNYVKSGISRTIINSTLILFFALAILLFVIAWFFKSGIMELFGKE